MNDNQTWTKIIKPKSSGLSIDFNEIWRYRDLVRQLVFREFVTFYKQTILGPIWFLVQPLFNAVINLVVFGTMAGIAPGGVPPFLFYLSGPIIWQYFQESFTKTAGTFRDNQQIFGKVYFPRILMPLSLVISGLMKFGIQMVILFGVILYFYFSTGNFYMSKEIYLFPFFILLLIFMSLGFGLIVTALTTKYRDLKFLIEFGIPLFKYVTPGIATSMALWKEKLPAEYHWVATYNPLGHLIDGFNYILMGGGELNWNGLAYTVAFTAVLLTIGIFVFNKTEKTFMDTV